MNIRSLSSALALPVALLSLFTLPSRSLAQKSASDPVEESSSMAMSYASAAPLATRGISSPAPVVIGGGPRPFSRASIGASISPLGVGVESSANLIPHVNVRLTGDYLGFGVNNYSAQGFNVDAKLHLASARFSADYYPFHNGFRLSPGVMFYNQNHANANFMAQSGTSFTLNDHTFYSASGARAVQGIGRVGLGNGSPAFTMTTGWGNTLPRAGKHLSFPFEIGAAFTQAPTFALNLNGYVCDAHGNNCVDVATDPTAQADLKAQVAKYQNNLEPLKTYPILSFGVAYSFGSGRLSQIR